MKILYSAFECNPGIGSDAYVGWSWAKQMSKMNEVHVLTTSGNRSNIEAYKEIHSDVNATFYYVDLPGWLKRLLKGRGGYFATYVLWQRYAYHKALELSKTIDFDIIHHVSIADFRINGLLWKLSPPFIYGPVGGGQETPHQLEDYVKRYKRNEQIRSIINNIAVSLPIYKKGIRQAAAVFVSNDETIAVLKKHLGNKVEFHQMCELGVDEEYLIERKELQHKRRKEVHILVSGRMMYRKGIELLLDALLRIKTSTPYVVDLYGSGHQIDDVRNQIEKRHLENVAILHGKVPFEEMPIIYAQSDIFVLPSLRETTGTAVIEAMANKLPVVALQQNGVKYLVKDDAGILAQIGSKEETIKNLADALIILIEDEKLCREMGLRGYESLNKRYTWEKKTLDMTEVYRTIVNKKAK